MEPPVTIENVIDRHIGEIALKPPPPIDKPDVGNEPTIPESPPDISAGIIVKVNDDEIDDEQDISTNDQLREAVIRKAVNNFGEFGNEDVIIAKERDFLPSPDSFVAYEEAPIIIENVLPIYSKIARRAGIEGVVWVSVLLDKSGKVRDVKASRANAGFEEAAIEAARQTIWKPAVSNGHPVALWVSYKVVFTLRCGKG